MPCPFVIQTGPKKNTVCGKTSLKGKTCCGYHKSSEPDATVDSIDADVDQIIYAEPVESVTVVEVVETDVAVEAVEADVAVESVVAPVGCTYVFARGPRKGKTCGERSCIHQRKRPLEAKEQPDSKVPKKEEVEVESVPQSESDSDSDSESDASSSLDSESSSEVSSLSSSDEEAEEEDEELEEETEESPEKMVVVRCVLPTALPTCPVIIQNGSRAGAVCGRSCLPNRSGCLLHTPRSLEDMEQENVWCPEEFADSDEKLNHCRVRLTSGQWKGTRCGNVTQTDSFRCIFHEKELLDAQVEASALVKALRAKEDK